MKQAIVVDNLSKSYHLGARGSAGQTLPEAITNRLKGAWNRLRGRGAKENPANNGEFWALRNVSFEVHPGEVIGVIGRNGAGKSTLLKILSQIVEPTQGKALIRGRLGSLLEVGTGFHPELSGRENVYLNGSILGMSRAEITRKFEEIIAFADIDAFLDTPVKRYSSGMYVRLAFAIAAHLHPEILVLDEVLAVGDSQFQRKCLGKMRDVSLDGRTVLFVSHDISAIRRLCTRSILMEKGRVVAVGSTADVVARYLDSGSTVGFPAKPIDLQFARRTGSGTAKFAEVMCYGENPQDNPTLHSGGPFNAVMTIRAEAPQMVDSIAVVLQDASGTKLVNADTIRLNKPVELQVGLNRLRIRIAALPLNPGIYHLGLWLARRPLTIFDWIESVCEVEIEPARNDDRPTPNADGLVRCDYDLLDG
jgi:ABC-type polysaccharide/polyol phosphate transport system ATPase subunit